MFLGCGDLNESYNEIAHSMVLSQTKVWFCHCECEMECCLLSSNVSTGRGLNAFTNFFAVFEKFSRKWSFLEKCYAHE